MTKQEKIEKLIQMEWEDFQKVNNEGGRYVVYLCD